MKRESFLAVVLFVAMLAAVPLGAGEAGATAQRPPVFPDVTLKPLSGAAPVRLSSLRGHPVLINFWATWCPPCRAELPELQGLYAQYSSRGLKVVAVNVNQYPAGVAEFVKEHGLTLPVYRMNEGTLRRLGVSSIPMSVLIDGTGRVAKVYSGYSPTMVRDIERRIAGMLPAPQARKGS